MRPSNSLYRNMNRVIFVNKNLTRLVHDFDEIDWQELFKRDPWRDHLSEEDWLLLPDQIEDYKAEMRCN